MRTLVSLSVVFALFATLSAGAQSNTKEINVTIYNNGVGVVREVREMDIPKGFSELKIADVPRDLVPATVKIDFRGRVLEQNFRFDIANFSSILNRYIDKNITLIGSKTYSGKLISISSRDYASSISVALQQADGSLTLVPSVENFEISLASMPDGFVTRPTLFWSVEADKGGRQDVELSYQTANMKWNAEYILVLNEDDTEAKLDSWVSLTNNSGGTFRDANLKLVAGNVRKVQREMAGYGAGVFNKELVATSRSMSNLSDFSDAPLFEYHVYELERKTTLADRASKQIALFSSERISTEKKFKFYISDNTVENLHPAVSIEFANSKANHLGSPMPEGNFQVMKTSGSSKELVGESKVAHMPKDERIKLALGDAFDVVIDNTVKSDAMISKNVNEREYEIKIKNHKNEAIKLDLIRSAEWSPEVISCSEKWEKENAYSVKIPVSVGADSEKTVTLKIRTTYKK